MNVTGVEINVRGTHTELLLKRRQLSVNAARDLSARVHPLRVLLAIQQQELPLLVVCHAIDRPLASQRAAHIVALAEQPLSQDRLTNLTLLLSKVRQRRLLS